MQRLLSNDDLRRLAGGVAIACAAGLMLGAALQPDLDEHDAAGPQILMGESGARKVFAAHDPGVGRYTGQIPEHVIGTDWTRPRDVPMTAYDDDPAPEEAVRTVVYEDPTPVAMARSAYAEEPPEPVYPSMRGSTHYEADLPPAPAPPADIDADLVISG